MRNFCKIAVFVLMIFACISDVFALTNRGLGRERQCSSNGGFVAEDNFSYDPLDGGKELEFVMTNGACIAIATSLYLDTKLSISLMNGICGSAPALPRPAPSPIQDLVDVAKGAKKCDETLSNACCISTARAAQSVLDFVAVLGTRFLAAKDVYENTYVCGANWMKPSPTTYSFSAADYKQTVQLKINNFIRTHPEKLTGDCNSDDCKTYREWFYGGVEYEDNPYQGAACLDPTRPKNNNGQYPRQRYYLKGTEAGNYNCKKYLVLPGQSTPYNPGDMRDAYKCCLNRSQNFMCLDYTNVNVVDNPPVQMRRTPTFCKKDDGEGNCTMMRPDYYDAAGNHNQRIQNGGIWFTIKSADSDGRLLCAQTYSLCPYDFYIGGGADECDYYRDGTYNEDTGIWTIITQEQIDAGQCEQNSVIRNHDCSYNDKVGKCKNYCQYLTHCTKVASDGYQYRSNLGSPYFAQACIDFVGDSKNNSGFNTGLVAGKQMHFTAPIAQCMKETLENLFYNRAGHSECATYNEYPDYTGVCASGQYVISRDPTTKEGFVYKKGNKVKSRSFFEMIQYVMGLVVKLGLTLAVVFYGVNLLLGKANLGDKKSILVFVFKIALVMYFCVGTAWQDMFFRGFYDASMSLAQILFKIEVQNEPLKQDGCQFGKIVYSDGTNQDVSVYPDGKSYLAIWDTIDCKMMRYLGFGPQVTTANFASMVISAYFVGPIGIYFAMSVMIFAFLLIVMAIRALHIFLSSAMAIILLVFMSPLVIPCGMFEKTKNIFNGWLGKLFSYCLQPMILFAYVAIFISVMDKTLIGSAIFKGNAPNKTMSCEKVCYDGNGNVVPYDGDQAPACDGDDQELVDPLNDSMACILNFQNFGTWKAFEVIGVSFPILKNLLSENVKQRVLTILKATLVMYLLYAFMDEIPQIISSLVGGGLAQKKGNAVAMLLKTISMVEGVSKRAGRLGDKALKGGARSAIEKVRESGSKDKGEGGESKGESSDQAGSRDSGGGDDHAGSSEEDKGGGSDSAGKE